MKSTTQRSIKTTVNENKFLLFRRVYELVEYIGLILRGHTVFHIVLRQGYNYFNFKKLVHSEGHIRTPNPDFFPYFQLL